MAEVIAVEAVEAVVVAVAVSPEVAVEEATVEATVVVVVMAVVETDGKCYLFSFTCFPPPLSLYFFFN